MGPGRLEGAPPESERRRPAAGRRLVPSTGQNTVLPAHSGLRPPFTTEERIRSVSPSRLAEKVAAATAVARSLSPGLPVSRSWPGLIAVQR